MEHRQAQHPDKLADEQVAAAVAGLAMLAEPTRLKLLWALRDGELGVTELAEQAGCRPTAASQHAQSTRPSAEVRYSPGRRLSGMPAPCAGALLNQHDARTRP